MRPVRSMNVDMVMADRKEGDNHFSIRTWMIRKK